MCDVKWEVTQVRRALVQDRGRREPIGATSKNNLAAVCSETARIKIRVIHQLYKMIRQNDNNRMPTQLEPVLQRAALTLGLNGFLRLSSIFFCRPPPRSLKCSDMWSIVGVKLRVMPATSERNSSRALGTSLAAVALYYTVFIIYIY